VKIQGAKMQSFLVMES